jgi:mannose-6-phosphate isomerase-like protein (cupin superfamily)
MQSSPRVAAPAAATGLRAGISFIGVDGELVVEFPDREVVVKPGQLVTVPAGTRHRTWPVGERSVNLTFERAGAKTVFED